MSNWNISLKNLSAFHFLVKMDEIFCGVRVDAKAAGNKFFGESRHSRNARKKLGTERMWIFEHF